MKYELYCLRDKVAGECSAPLMFNNSDCAKRWANNKVTENKEDFSLEFIGTYDTNTGDIAPVADRIVVWNGFQGVKDEK